MNYQSISCYLVCFTIYELSKHILLPCLLFSPSKLHHPVSATSAVLATVSWFVAVLHSASPVRDPTGMSLVNKACGACIL